jgi:hypothetical protein
LNENEFSLVSSSLHLLISLNHPVQIALALYWTPLLSLRAGGEISSVLQYAPTPALEKFKKENEKENGNEFSLVSSSPHPLIPFMRIIYRLPISGKQQRFAKWKIYWSDPLKIVF